MRKAATARPAGGARGASRGGRATAAGNRTPRNGKNDSREINAA